MKKLNGLIFAATLLFPACATNGQIKDLEDRLDQTNSALSMLINSSTLHAEHLETIDQRMSIYFDEVDRAERTLGQLSTRTRSLESFAIDEKLFRDAHDKRWPDLMIRSVPIPNKKASK